MSRGHARHASYDLSVGKVIVGGEEKQPKGGKNCKYFVIEPQEVAVIVSKENVRVPTKGVSCYVFPKTGLCKEGLLVLNTGIVDPGYCGLISTTAVNFHKTPLKLYVGDAFLRLAFVQLFTGTAGPAKVNRIKSIRYWKERLNEAEGLPPTFLDVPASVERMRREVREQMVEVSSKNMTKLIALLALVATLVLSLVPVVVPLAAQAVGVYTPDGAQDEQIRQLQEEVDALRSDVDRLRNNTR